METATAYGLYGLAWGSFGLLHSLLSGRTAKLALGGLFGVRYRLAFNLLAVAHIAAILFIGNWLFEGFPVFDRSDAINVLQLFAAIVGWGVLLLSLREYDLGRFAGTTQIREREDVLSSETREPLLTGGFHAFVRHPIYAGAHLILWGGVRGDFGLATAVFGSIYLLIGARFEERRLEALYGDAYRDYRRKVPSLIPWKGRVR